MKTYPIILGGVKTQTDEIVTVRFPFTGEAYAQVCQTSSLDLKAVVTEAVKGFETIKKLLSGTRSQILSRRADGIHSWVDELAEVLVIEGDKTKTFAAADAALVEIAVRTSAEEAKRIYSDIISLDWSYDTVGSTGFLQRVPFGSMVGIAPQ